MKKQPSDEQFDTLMRKLVKDASADELLVDEIADAPQLWWSVQRNIVREKGQTVHSPATLFRRWLMIGFPAAAALLLVFGIFSFRPADVAKTDLAGLQQNGVTQTAEASVEIIPEPAVPVKNTSEIETFAPKAASLKRPSAVQAVRKRVPRRTIPATFEITEIKSEFIALSNVGNPESGQIVRVKVPSSMMVTLGLVQSVAKPSNLIDAEVVVGDDGMNHAIRFIRQ